MPKLAANLSFLFNEVPFLDRFEKAARAGFSAVELLFPYEWSISELQARLQQTQLKLVLHNMPPGQWNAGERGIACHPDRRDEFREGVFRSIDYATALGVPQLNCLAGLRPAGFSEADLRKVYIENLSFAANALKKAGLRLLIEPINLFDIPGFYLTTTRQAVEVLNSVNADNAYIQYDIYHAQRMEGELIETIRRLMPRIAHMQLADNPGRHEPGTGEINFANLFAEIDRLGYKGWIGCEYKPYNNTEEGLVWREKLGA